MKLSFTLRQKPVKTGRGASLNFLPVRSIHTLIAHNWRQQKNEPKYLLPKEHRRQNVTLLNDPGSARPALLARFNADQARRTKRAKTEGRASWVEACINLPMPPENPAEHEAWAAQLYPKLKRLGTEIERTTGLRLMDSVAHWDEGKLYANGRVKYNGHAHLTFCRLQPDGRMIRFKKAQLSKLQDLAATVLGMKRGEKGTFTQHLPPEAYRQVMEAKDKGVEQQKLLAAEQSKNDALQRSLEKANAERHAALVELLKAQERVEELQAPQTPQNAPGAFSQREAYLELRGAFKASEGAIQAHYRALKRLHEQGNENAIASLHRKIGDERALFAELEHVTGIDFDALDKRAQAAEPARQQRDDDYSPR